MKKITFTILTGLALAATAQAGEDYSSKAPAPMPPPAPTCLWSWFAGGSVGYLQDADTAMYTLHVGTEFKCAGSESSHGIFLEVGYADSSDSYRYTSDTAYPRGEKATIDTTFIPITLNYKYENRLVGNLNWYIGGGAGIAIFDADYKNTEGFKNSSSNTEFMAQAFAGLVYNVSETFEVFGGARYIYVSDGKLRDFNLYSDDVLYEAGVRFNF